MIGITADAPSPVVRLHNSHNILGGLLFCLMMSGLFTTPVQAQLTPQHRRDLTALRREATKAASLIRRKETDEAQKILSETEEKLKSIMSEAGVTEQDIAIAGVQKAIDLQKAQLERAMGGAVKKGAGGVSFKDEVAPILAENCLGCHDEQARGGLRLDTFAGMRKGGSSGPLLTPGNPQRSLLAFRLVAPGQQRMPRGQAPLERDEINTIAEWISQGAKYDHSDESVLLSNLDKAGMKKPEIKVAKPEGNETVSFKEDIAPMLVTFCLGCHSGNNPASGFSVETFEKILIGGDSGEVLIPGNLEDSRLFRLTGGLEAPRMPQGQARITRKNYEDLKAWIQEGIKYDVDDPKMLLREIVPTDEEKLAMQLREMPEPEFRKYRQEQAEAHWRRTLSSAKPVSVTTEQFLVMGNVDVSRLDTVVGWAEASIKDLQEKFGLTSPPKWKGRLAIYVFKDRYDYDEFNRSIENRQAAKTLFGHGHVTNNQNQAYVAVLDTGDTSSASQPALQWTLSKSLISAYLQTNAANRPNWLMEGAGWALSDTALQNKDYEKSMLGSAAGVLRSLERPETLFQNGTFAPDATEHVGFAITQFLLKSGNREQFRRFVKMLIDGQDINQACRAVYNATANDLANTLRRAL